MRFTSLSPQAGSTRLAAAALKPARQLPASLALAVAMTSAAVAQEAPTELQRLVITASGGAVEEKDAPASITVLTAEQIEKMPAQDVRQLLAKVEGITIGRAGNMNTIQIRGLGQRYTLFLVDGKRVNSAPNLFRGNDYDSDWVPLDAIERIEVVRGPMSSLYGSDAIGGVINIITKKSADAWHGSVTAEYIAQQNRKAGNSWRTGFFVSGPLSEKVGLKLYGSWDRREADDPSINPNSSLPGFTESDNKYIDGTVTWRPNDSNEIDLNYGYSHRNHDDFPLDRHSVGLTHRGDYDFGTTELKLWGDRVHNYRGHGNTLGVDQPNTAYNAGIDGKVVLPLDYLKPQTLTVGASYRYQGIEDPYVLTGGGDTSSSVWQAALFVEDEIRFTDDFAVTLGNRLDVHENFGVHNSPRAYGVYHFTEAFTLKGGWSSAFKAPTLLENSPNWQQISCGGGCYLIGSTDLEPETSNSFELGVNYEDERWTAGVTAFRNDLKNMIPFPPNRTSDPITAPDYPNFVGFTPDGKPIFTYENVDRARTQGIEAKIALRAFDTWTFTANYTYLDARNLSGAERPLAYQPEHSANFGVEWQATEKLNLALNVSYVGDQYTYVPSNGNMASASKMDAFVTADIVGKYDFNERFTVRAGVLNIADKRVTRTISDDFNVDGRRFFFSATGRF
ncbi:TonB-dependent receptor domain-containing protein [Mesorhizobium australicum]|uniref:Outer membrane receptor for ferrienterochelin and colicins n=1 Tax=Mesorhizobium australicum TaxID=536018 RepID=A0A1X7NFM7_9HYPH|nr:TonB-dependent receptor [Mesorhizobium australicum]SMH36146.1 outer membrane receptor for ferrienterochelin and colicins [Mesorhizobium australicum]